MVIASAVKVGANISSIVGIGAGVGTQLAAIITNITTGKNKKILFILSPLGLLNRFAGGIYNITGLYARCCPQIFCMSSRGRMVVYSSTACTTGLSRKSLIQNADPHA